MKQIGTLQGQGSVSHGPKIFGEITYSIHIYEDRALRSGRGTFRGDFGKLYKAMEAPQLSLKLKDGTEVGVVITNLNSAGEGLLVTSGSIPGF